MSRSATLLPHTFSGNSIKKATHAFIPSLPLPVVPLPPSVTSGKKMSSDEWRKRFIFSPVLQLSPAEFRVFELLGLNLTVGGMALVKGMARSPNTIYTHLDRMRQKTGMGIKRLRSMAMAYRQYGLQREPNPDATPYRFR